MSPLVPQNIFRLVCDRGLKQTPAKTKHMQSAAFSPAAITASVPPTKEVVTILLHSQIPHPSPSPLRCVDI